MPVHLRDVILKFNVMASALNLVPQAINLLLYKDADHDRLPLQPGTGSALPRVSILCRLSLHIKQPWEQRPK